MVGGSSKVRVQQRLEEFVKELIPNCRIRKIDEDRSHTFFGSENTAFKVSFFFGKHLEHYGSLYAKKASNFERTMYDFQKSLGTKTPRLFFDEDLTGDLDTIVMDIYGGTIFGDELLAESILYGVELFVASCLKILQVIQDMNFSTDDAIKNNLHTRVGLHIPEMTTRNILDQRMVKYLDATNTNTFYEVHTKLRRQENPDKFSWGYAQPSNVITESAHEAAITSFTIESITLIDWELACISDGYNDAAMWATSPLYLIKDKETRYKASDAINNVLLRHYPQSIAYDLMIAPLLKMGDQLFIMEPSTGIAHDRGDREERALAFMDLYFHVVDRAIEKNYLDSEMFRHHRNATVNLIGSGKHEFLRDAVFKYVR